MCGWSWSETGWDQAILPPVQVTPPPKLEPSWRFRDKQDAQPLPAWSSVGDRQVDRPWHGHQGHLPGEEEAWAES